MVSQNWLKLVPKTVRDSLAIYTVGFGLDAVSYLSSSFNPLIFGLYIAVRTWSQYLMQYVRFRTELLTLVSFINVVLGICVALQAIESIESIVRLSMLMIGIALLMQSIIARMCTNRYRAGAYAAIGIVLVCILTRPFVSMIDPDPKPPWIAWFVLAILVAIERSIVAFEIGVKLYASFVDLVIGVLISWMFSWNNIGIFVALGMCLGFESMSVEDALVRRRIGKELFGVGMFSIAIPILVVALSTMLYLAFLRYVG